MCLELANEDCGRFHFKMDRVKVTYTIFYCLMENVF